jgi:hypothetical protein
MYSSLRIAFLATALLATAAQAAPKAPPPPPPAPPAPQFLGSDAGIFGIAGTADAAFFVTLDAGRYVITGDIRTTSASNKNFNLTGVTLTSGTASDSFENHGSNDYFENPFTLTLTGSTNLLLAVDTNDKAKGAYAGSLTIAEVPLAQPVSEPATAAFLLAGVGLLGISARRRRL